MRNQPLNRRTLLRGTGVALALPMLEAMYDRRGRIFNGRALAAAKPPIRFVAVPWVDGVDSSHSLWKPTTVGKDFELPKGMASLAKWKSDINVISGLSMNYTDTGVIIFQHAAGEISRFTCMPPTYDPRPADKEVPIRGGAGPSLEWLLAQKMPKETLLPAVSMSLPLADYRDGSGSSWMGREQPTPLIYKPRDLFNKLFKPGSVPAAKPGTPPTPTVDLEEQKRRAMQQSALHYAKDSAVRLKSQLGTEDGRRLDQHLTAISEVERQMKFLENTPSGGGSGTASGATCTMPSSPADPAGDEACMKLYAQLLAMAFRCDVVRYAMVDIHKIKTPTNLGPVEDDHSTSHGSANAAFAFYLSEKMRYLGMILEELKNSPEGDKNVLFNSIIYSVSDVARGPHHDWGDMPVLVAGNAGGQIVSGRHLSHKGVTLNNLSTALLKYAGAPIEKYGSDATGPLPGLDT